MPQKFSPLGCIVAFFLALPGVVSTAQGHGALHEQFAYVNRELAARPDDPELLLRRADLHRQHHDWVAAIQDIDSAAQAGAAPGPFAMSRAQLAASQGGWELALDNAVDTLD